MPEFERFLDRHGEGLLQEIIERIERNEGIRSSVVVPLEERWTALMQNCSQQQHFAA